jgi:tRNA/rRNA methyltransferase
MSLGGATPPDIAVVLVRPRVPDNLGAVCRLMGNYGLTDLRLVTPVVENLAKIRAVAAAAGREVFEGRKEYGGIGEAVASLSWTIGLTARHGRRRMTKVKLRGLHEHIDGLPAGTVGLVFGTEDSGLTDEELAHCREAVTIPTMPEFPSLNLSHAVAITLHEAVMAPQPSSRARRSDPATLGEVEAMEAHLTGMLLRIGFLMPGHEGRMMAPIREMIGRGKPTAREVALIRGVCHRVELALEGKTRWGGKAEDGGWGKKEMGKIEDGED